jgi:hypothetical protein
MTDNEKTGYDEEQLKFRSQHGFLIWDSIRAGNGRQIEARMRDGWMSRLYASLSEAQQDAMVEIEIGYRSIIGGLGFKTMNPGKPQGKAISCENERQAQRISDYFAWGREMQRRKLSHAMAMAIISEGKTCAQVDVDYRQRKGTGRTNLIASLNVFCNQHGWPTSRGP